MMRRWRGLIGLLFGLLLLAGTLRAAPPEGAPLVVQPLAAQQEASAQLRLLRDPQEQLGLPEVLARLDDFRPASRHELLIGFNPGIIWLHLRLVTPADQPLTRWLAVGSSKTQVVTAYQRQQGQDGEWQAQRSGRAVVPLERPIVTLAPVFPVWISPGQTTELLLRVDSRGTTDLATHLWQPEAYHPLESRQVAQVAVLLGGLLLGGGLALVVYAALHEGQYLWHALLLLAIAGLEASRTNFLGTFVWPADRLLPPASLALFAGLALFSLSKMAAHALELATRMPAAHHLLMGLRWFAVGSTLITSLHYGYGVRLLSITAIMHNLAVLGLSLLAWRRDLPNGRIFLIGFSMALLVEIARQLANQGLLPWAAALDTSSWFFLLGSPLILIGLLAQTRRLSDRLRFTEELQTAKSAFLARVSHELRAPLNTILGYSRMLARGSAKLSLAEGTSGIEKSSLRLLRLIDELLDEARAAAGKLTIQPTPLALRPWFGEIEHAARLTCEAHGNRFECVLSGDVPAMVRIDGQRLRQVLENLLANANRHTRDGTLTLACQAEQPDLLGDTVVLAFAVEDDGEGIAPDRLASLFDPFERGETSQPGHGLGLAICRELIRQMGSDIVASSTPGQGSRFAFTLHCPLVSMTSSPAAGADLPTMPANHVPLADAPRALLVDDDPLQLKLLEFQFDNSGIATVTASSGQAALDALHQADWDIVVTDQMMPEIDGWQVLQRVRQEKPGLPVMMLSAVPSCRPANMPPMLDFDIALLKPCAAGKIIASAWQLILKVGAGGTALDWSTLARLAGEGDVSGIEDWIATSRATAPEREHTLRWMEGLLHRLDLQVLEQIALHAARGITGPLHRLSTP